MRLSQQTLKKYHHRQWRRQANQPLKRRLITKQKEKLIRKTLIISSRTSNRLIAEMFCWIIKPTFKTYQKICKWIDYPRSSTKNFRTHLTQIVKVHAAMSANTTKTRTRQIFKAQARLIFKAFSRPRQVKVEVATRFSRQPKLSSLIPTKQAITQKSSVNLIVMPIRLNRCSLTSKLILKK